MDDHYAAGPISLTDDICQRVLSRAHNDLVQKLNVQGAFDAVRSELDPKDKQDIESLFTVEAKCRVLIRIISKGGVHTYQKLKDYMNDNQEDLFQIVAKYEQELLIDQQEITLDREAVKIRADWKNEAVKRVLSQVDIYTRTNANSYRATEQASQMLQTVPQTTELKPKEACSHTEVENEIKKIGKHVHDGRLVKLSPAYIEHVKDCLSDPSLTAEGGYGTVYITRGTVKGFDKRLVLKELNDNTSNKSQILASVTNEKLASRVLHFAIVPLVAYHDDIEKGKHYFIAPYLENGDLYKVIQSDRKMVNKNYVLYWTIRLKIMNQIACAIDYLHTGNSFRGTILHMDIKSNNIVLDSKLNARLIDFGLAREVKEGRDLHTMTPVHGTQGYHPTVKHDRLTPQHDYHNFGVVMRELLTGVDPVESEKETGKELRKWDSRKVAQHIDYRIWPKTSPMDKMVALSDQCIESVKQIGTLTSDCICQQLKDFMRTENVKPWTGLDDGRCEICMVNEQDENNPVADINHKDCTLKIKICHACMRNSYFNPIKCYGCGKDIKAVIGDGWGAVLIAGYDKKNGKLFQKDVNEFGDAITSTVLPAMCISKSNMVVIDFNTNTQECASSRIQAAFKQLIVNGVRTLVFLYSGHHGGKGFEVGEHKYYQIDELSKIMNDFTDLEKVIAFLDCCFPKPIDVPERVCLIQFNATGPNDKAESIQEEGSIFTKFLVQAFTMKASGGTCKLEGCDCSISGDFITLGSLWDYIELHRKRGGLLQMKPHQNTKNVCWEEIHLSYNYTFKVKFCFDIRVPVSNISQTIDVLPTRLTDFRALKPGILFPGLVELLRTNMKCQAKVRSEVLRYADILVIEVDGGPRQTQEIDNMEKLLIAWNSKLLLRCKLRQWTEIDCGRPVGLFLQNGNIVSKIMSRFNPKEQPLDMQDVERLKAELNKHEKKNENTEFIEPLKTFIDAVHELVHATKDNKLKSEHLIINCIDVFEDRSVTLVYLELKGKT